MLMRALGHVENGFYIDIGAQHPRVDSVSRAFYELGWRGIHAEPVSEYVKLLREDRPDEVVLQVLVSDSSGSADFFEIPDTGLSTVSEDIASEHAARGFSIRRVEVEKTTLTDVFRQTGHRSIHWLKIDVEGSERAVLEGWKRHPARPWVIVIESTLPLTQTSIYESWEPCLRGRGYRFVYFDGLNRFYVHKAHSELRDFFDHGPCVFDDFALSGLASAPFCERIIASAD